MPTLLPASRRSIRDALLPWMPDDVKPWIVAEDPTVEFQSYDWSLGCAVR
jgi:hypothetical protein